MPALDSRNTILVENTLKPIDSPNSKGKHTREPKGLNTSTTTASSKGPYQLIAVSTIAIGAPSTEFLKKNDKLIEEACNKSGFKLSD